MHDQPSSSSSRGRAKSSNGCRVTLGMNSHAASAAMDIARVKFDAGEDVRELCAEIVPLLTKAGLTQNAIEALAYIREQAQLGALTTGKIARVRTYFDELVSAGRR